LVQCLEMMRSSSPGIYMTFWNVVVFIEEDNGADYIGAQTTVDAGDRSW
jgi:hypothetical protein